MNEVAAAAAVEPKVATSAAESRAAASTVVSIGVALLPLALLAFSLYRLNAVEVVAFSPFLVLLVAAFLFPMAPRKMDTNRHLAAAAGLAIVASIVLTLLILFADVYHVLGMSLMGASAVSVANGSISVDAFSLVFNLIFLFAGLIVAVASATAEVDRAPYQGVYFMLLMLTLVGAMLVASAASLISIFLGLELAGISTYAMVAFVKSNKLTSEAAVKYYLIGSVSTGLLLFGLSYLYGMTGSLDIHTISVRLHTVSGASAGVVIAIVFLLAGFGFKMAAVPFHLWAPDVYTGSPSPVSALLAAGTKKMGFAAGFKVLAVGMVAVRAEWAPAIAIVAVLTMTLGNTAALLQSNFKRMMAYSSIAHAGYILVALAAAGAAGAAAETGVAAGIFHSMVHMVMASAAFVAVGLLVAMQVGDDVDDLRGLRTRAPTTSLCLVILMFSLIGVPPLVGFWSKYYIGLAAWQAGGWYQWLVLALFVNSGYSAYYYLRIIRTVYFDEAPEGAPRLREPRALMATLVALVVFTVVAGVFPEPFFVLMRSGADALLALT